jgi:pilus assembly protein CpaF
MSDLAGDQPAPGGRHQSKQELKRHLYNQLLTRLNLDRLTVTGRAEAEGELRTVLFSMFEETHRGPISTAEREAIITDVLNEVFGLGPLDALLGDAEISAILVNRFDQVFVERNGKLEPSDYLRAHLRSRYLTASSVTSYRR